MPTSELSDAAALQRGVVRIARSADGVELYFPPLRSPAAALALAAFGAVSTTLSLLAVLGLIPAGGSDAHGLMAITLIGAFVAPFLVFGLVFMVLGAYMLANSLTVVIGTAKIRSARRVLGVPLAQREMRCADIAAIEPHTPPKYERLFSAEPSYRLIARNRGRPASTLLLAEGLRGEAAMDRIRTLITNAAGLSDRNGRGNE